MCTLKQNFSSMFCQNCLSTFEKFYRYIRTAKLNVFDVYCFLLVSLVLNDVIEIKGRIDTESIYQIYVRLHTAVEAIMMTHEILPKCLH